MDVQTRIPQPLTRAAINLRRYERRYARNKPAPIKPKVATLAVHDRRLVIRGFVQWMQQVVRMQFGEPGKWGHGRFQNARRKGPGRRPLARLSRINPCGTKLVKRWIRDGIGEQTVNRRTYAAITGKQYHERYG